MVCNLDPSAVEGPGNPVTLRSRNNRGRRLLGSRFRGNDVEGLAVEDPAGRRMAVLPPLPLERGRVVVLRRVADAEMPDEDPVRWHVKDRGDAYGSEDRPPPHAEAFGARGEPQRVDCDDHRVVERLRHGEAPEPSTLRGRAIGE